MCVCVCLCVMCVSVCICLSVYLFMHLSICMCACICVSHVCSVLVCLCMCAQVYTCCVYMSICVYVFTNECVLQLRNNGSYFHKETSPIMLRTCTKIEDFRIYEYLSNNLCKSNQYEHRLARISGQYYVLMFNYDY